VAPVLRDAAGNCYDPVHNPEGIVSLRIPENRLCDAGLQLRLSQCRLQIPEGLKNSVDPSGWIGLRKALAQVMQDHIFQNRVPVSPDCLICSNGCASTLKMLVDVIPQHVLQQQAEYRSVRESRKTATCRCMDALSFSVCNARDVRLRNRQGRKVLCLGVHCQDFAHGIAVVAGVETVKAHAQPGQVPSDTDLDQALAAHPGIVVCWLTRPGDLTQAIWSKEELLRLVHWCRRKHICLVSDETHAAAAAFADDGSIQFSIMEEADVTTWDLGGTLATVGVGCSVAFCRSPEFVTALKRANQLHALSNVAQAVLAQILSDSMFMQRFFSEARSSLQVARETAEAGLRRLSIRFESSSCGRFLWADFSEFGLDSDTLCQRLLDECKVLVSPGNELQAPPSSTATCWIRLCFAACDSLYCLEHGLWQLECFIANQRGENSQLGTPVAEAPATVVFRAAVNSSYALCFAHSSCQNGGRVHMWETPEGSSDICCQWLLFDGVLRSKADLGYVLCARRDGLVNGGGVHVWKFKSTVDPWGKWVLRDGVLYSQANLDFCLCATRHGCKNGSYVHLWSFGSSAPDKRGRWEVAYVDYGVPDVITPASQNDANTTREEEFRPLAAAVKRFREASLGLPRLHREHFFEALEALAEILNMLGGGVGDYISVNVVKFRSSIASTEEMDYRLWLRSELPLHAENGYRGYVDASAWMANLWTGRILEFVVELCAQLESGSEVSTGFLNAHELTLQKHHNMFASMVFRAAALRVPNRVDFLASLGGGAPQAVVVTDLAEYVRIARPVVNCCLEMDAELDSLRQAEQAALAHGRSADKGVIAAGASASSSGTTLSTLPSTLGTSGLELSKELETHTAD